MGGAICCAGTTCCSCMCNICMQCCGTSHQQHTRLGYLVITIFSIIFGLVFLYFGQDLMKPFEQYGLDCQGDTKSVCLGVYTIYRESFALVIFYFLMILGSSSGGRNSLAFNQSCWTLKVLIISSVFVASFFIPNDFFDVFKEICRYVSVFYLLIQVIVIVDFGYTWSESWTDSYMQSGNTNSMLGLLFFFSGLFWVVSITLTVLSYFWFMGSDGCYREMTLITCTLVLGIVFTILSLTNCVENGSLLTSSVVNCYCTYLCWDGLTNDTDTSCNTWDNAQETGIIIGAGIFVLMITMAYISFRKREKISEQSHLRGAAEPILASENEGEEDKPYKEDHEMIDEDYGKKMIYFHLFMFLSSFYMSMLLTNWGSAVINSDQNGSYSNNEGSMWVKFSAQWATIALYVWSLIAPKICASRDFS